MSTTVDLRRAGQEQKKVFVEKVDFSSEDSQEPVRDDENTCQRVGEIALAILEVVGLILANFVTVGLINISEAVRNEYVRIYVVFFGERKVTVVPSKDSNEEKGTGEAKPGNVTDRVKGLQKNLAGKPTSTGSKGETPEKDKTKGGQHGTKTGKANPEPQPQPKPKKEEKTELDTLTPEQRDALVLSLQNAVLTQKKDEANRAAADEINSHCQKFDDACCEAERIALNLHTEFTKAYVNDKSSLESPPSFDNQKRITTSSLFQLKIAIGMVKKVFPGLVLLAFNKDTKVLIARLVQIVLCGEQALKAKYPFSSCCFKLKELEGKTSPQWTCPPEPSQAQNPYLYNTYKEEGVDLRVSIAQVICQYAENAYENKLTGEGEELRRFLEDAMKHLEKSSSAITQSVQEYTLSLFLKDLGFNGPSGESICVWLEEVKQQIKVKDHVQIIDDLFDVSKNFDRRCGELANKFGVEFEDIQWLFDIKFLEWILLRSKKSCGESIKSLESLLEGYKDGGVLGKSFASSYLFSQEFTATELVISHDITIEAHHFLQEGIGDVFFKEVVVAEVTTLDVVEGLPFPEDQVDTKGHPLTAKKYTALNSLAFSWQTPISVMDYLTSRVDEGALNQQPAQQFLMLTKELEEGCQKLDEMSRHHSGGSSLSKVINFFSAYWIPKEKAGEEPNLENAILNEVNEAKATIDAISETLNQFLRAAVLSKQNEHQVNPSLILLRGALSRLHQALSQRQVKLAGEKQLPASEMFTDLLKEVRGLLSRIDEKKIGEKTVLERFQGLYKQTQNHKEISWKVKRYETQISQLKALFEKKFADEISKAPEALSESVDFFASAVMVDPNEGALVRTLYRELERSATKIEKNKRDRANKKERYTQNHLDAVRDGYNGFLKAFRKEFDHEMKKGKPDSSNRKYLEQIGILLYTEMTLRDRSRSTLKLFSQLGAEVLGQDEQQRSKTYEEGKKVPHVLVQEIETFYDRMDAAPYTSKAPLINQYANSAQGQYNRNFDPNMQSNPMHVLYELKVNRNGDENTVRVLGMGCPTSEDYLGELSIVPEWRAAMQGYKKAGMRHLYVSNQNLIPVKGMKKIFIDGDETARANGVMNFQKEDDVKDAFYAITLSKNSPFFHQKGEYAEQSNAEQFKSELHRQVFEMDPEISGNWISDEVKALCPQSENKASGIISLIHQIMFDSREELTLEERKQFIDLFQSKLVKHFIVQGEFNSTNNTCKDGIDRAADSVAQSYTEDAITFAHQKGNGNLRALDIEMAQMLILIRALLVRKRPVIHERLERFNESYDFRLNNGKKLLELHTHCLPDTVIIPS